MHPRGHSTPLDLAICSPTLLPMLNFEVDKDLHNSDHFPLLVSHFNGAGTRFRPPTYHFHRADWDKFTRLAIITGTMVQNRAVDDAILNVFEAIRNAADATIPKTSNSPPKLCKPWWNASCQQAKKEQRSTWCILRRYPTTDNLIEFKHAKALARRIHRQCQRESWINKSPLPIQPNMEVAGVSYLMARSHSDPHSKTWKRSKEPSQLSTDSTHKLPLMKLLVAELDLPNVNIQIRNPLRGLTFFRWCGFHSRVLWQTRSEWNEVVSDVFHFCYDDRTDCSLGKLALGAECKLLEDLWTGEVSLGSCHAEVPEENLSFASQAAR
ncbi:hypothetical protein TNCV_657291 [Trichonephila clavipes]|nr:hypothetical protein TNCV_657291 [Trichonephila clavipes]